MKTSSFLLRFLLFFSFVLILASCSTDELEESTPQVNQNDISPETQPIVPKPK